MFIEVNDAVKEYGQGENKIHALDHASLGIEEGEICVILGPSGSGKSTLLNMLGGLDSLDSGSVRVGDTELTGLGKKELTEYRRRDIGVVFQSYNLIGNLTLCAEYDNSHMGNEDFAFKKSILSKTLHIRMNTDILKQKKWNKDQILKRCDALAAQIIRIYPYNGANAVRKEPQPAVIVDEEIYSLSAPTVSARAIRHSDSDVEVLAGSVMKEYGAREMKTMRSLYLDLDDRGIFHTIDGGRIQFTQSWHFKDLNTAAQFLMHRGGDNREAWKKETASVKETAEQPAEPKKKSRNTGKVRREVRKIKGKKKKTAAA